MDDAAASDAAALAARADVVVVTDVPFGHGNVDNLRGAVEAVEAGVRGVLVGGVEGRDFTGGEATALWKRATTAGAVEVMSLDGVEIALDGTQGRGVGPAQGSALRGLAPRDAALPEESLLARARQVAARLDWSAASSSPSKPSDASRRRSATTQARACCSFSTCAAR